MGRTGQKHLHLLTWRTEGAYVCLGAGARQGCSLQAVEGDFD